MKLFRKIRQTLIKEGNLKRYLLYAIGEILLVMIGISLAFRVDNWNNDQINRAAEIKYYQNIRDQITKDKTLIQSEILYNERHMLQFEYAAEIIETNDRSKLDTLGIIALKLTNYSDFDGQGKLYLDLDSKKQMEHLKLDLKLVTTENERKMVSRKIEEANTNVN